jgi:hypothetical protein
MLMNCKIYSTLHTFRCWGMHPAGRVQGCSDPESKVLPCEQVRVVLTVVSAMHNVPRHTHLAPPLRTMHSHICWLLPNTPTTMQPSSIASIANLCFCLTVTANVMGKYCRGIQWIQNTNRMGLLSCARKYRWLCDAQISNWVDNKALWWLSLWSRLEDIEPRGTRSLYVGRKTTSDSKTAVIKRTCLIANSR